MAYEKLFETGKIGPLTLRNRAVMAPMSTDFADHDGNASPQLAAYYAERAKGGIGLALFFKGVYECSKNATRS